MTIEKFIEALPDGADVLVAGCGSGAAVSAVAGSGKAGSVVGTDSNGQLVALARAGAAAREAGAEFHVRPAAGLCDVDRAFDAVLVCDGAGLPFNRGGVLASAARALGPSGFAVARDIVVTLDGRAARKAQRAFGQLGFGDALTIREYEGAAHEAGFDAVTFEDVRSYTADEVRQIHEARGSADRLDGVSPDAIDGAFAHATVMLTKRG